MAREDNGEEDDDDDDSKAADNGEFDWSIDGGVGYISLRLLTHLSKEGIMRSINRSRCQ